MNTILVWVMMSLTYHSAPWSYSPPVADLESCERMRNTVRGTVQKSQCVQIRVFKEINHDS